MILFSETQINQVTNNTDINAGYAIEGIANNPQVLMKQNSLTDGLFL